MSVKRTNETTFKDNKNANENVLKFSMPAELQRGDGSGGGGNEAKTGEGTHVSDFETEMEKETEILSSRRKEMVDVVKSAFRGEKTSTNHKHLQKQFNNSNYSKAKSVEEVKETLIMNRQIAQNLRIEKNINKPTEEDFEKTGKSTLQAVSNKMVINSSLTSGLRETPTCLHIYICESPSVSLFQRSSLLWRFCCLCSNTMDVCCSPLLKDLFLLVFFLFIFMFLLFSMTYSKPTQGFTMQLPF